MYLVSACLLGVKSKYDGGEHYSPSLAKWVTSGEKVCPVCPEQLGGLPTPRQPCEITGGDGSKVWTKQAKVIRKDGKEVTEELIRGARQTLKLARILNIKEAILKEGSPSCGVHEIRDGTFKGRWIKGEGVTTSLLKVNGIKVYSHKELYEELKGERINEPGID